MLSAIVLFDSTTDWLRPAILVIALGVPLIGFLLVGKTRNYIFCPDDILTRREKWTIGFFHGVLSLVIGVKVMTNILPSYSKYIKEVVDQNSTILPLYIFLATVVASAVTSVVIDAILTRFAGNYRVYKRGNE